MNRLKLIPVITLLCICTFLVTCSKENDTPIGPDPNLGVVDVITTVPLIGPPGTILTVSGLQLDTANVENYTALVGGEAAPIRIDIGSQVQVAIPLFLDTIVGWPSTPTDSVFLEILLDGKVVARTERVIFVDSLPHASGITDSIKRSLDTILADFQLLFSALPVHHSWEQEYRDSLLTVVGSLISGPDISLAAVMDGSSSLLDGASVDLELTDALMESSGAAAYWQQYLSVFSTSSRKLRENIESLQAQGLLCPNLGPDMDLACKMQLYVLVHDWATEFLSETRADWESNMGWLFDIVSLYPSANAFPPVVVGKLIGGILTISDVLVNNAVLSLLPSHISNFEMTLQQDTIAVNEFTRSQIFITAANSPQQMTINEMVDLVLATMGLQATPSVQDIRMIVLNVVKFIVDKLRILYSYLATIAPDIFQKPELVDGTWFAFPDMTWGPVEVRSNDLVELFSFYPEILEPDSAVYEWWSVDCGEGRIQARTRVAGERSKVIRDWLFCMGCEYTGGAFGEDIAYTETKSVIIGQKGGLELSITGLPAEEDADVLVIYPDGTTFKHITATETIADLESGNYQVQANDVTASDGTAYIGKPESQMVNVICDSTVTVNIEYVEKYGNLLVTVSGVPVGLQANIDVSGPDGVSIHVVSDTLIDSLEEGTYTVRAYDIIDPVTQELISPTPISQTVIVEAGQTASSPVRYGGRATMTLMLGNPYTNIKPSGIITRSVGSEAFVNYSSHNVYEIQRIYDPPIGAVNGPALECSNGELIGGDEGGLWGGFAEITANRAEGELNYRVVNDTAVRIEFNTSATSGAPSVDDWDAGASSSIQIGAYGYAILVINNPGSEDVHLWYDYHITGYGASSDPSMPPSGGVVEMGLTRKYSCTNLGVNSSSDFSQLFRINTLTEVWQDEGIMLVIPPGETFVELMNMVHTTARSWDKYGHSAILTQNNRMIGTIDITLRPIPDTTIVK